MRLLTVNDIRTDRKYEVVAEDARQAKHIICSHYPKTVMANLKVWRSINMENKQARLLS